MVEDEDAEWDWDVVNGAEVENEYVVVCPYGLLRGDAVQI